jgi:hypothetical protein
MEWAVINPHNVPATDRHGRPNFAQTCTDNDPSCDFDLDADDHTCEFHVVACLNNRDPNLPGCSPLGIASPVRVTQPSARRDAANYNALATALQNLRNPTTGETGHGLPLVIRDTNFCTAPIAIRVPLRRVGRPSAMLRTCFERLRMQRVDSQSLPSMPSAMVRSPPEPVLGSASR